MRKHHLIKADRFNVLPRRLLNSARQAGLGFISLLPIMLGTLLLTSLIIPILPQLFEGGLFGQHPVIDALTGAGIGSIAAGQPMISYLLGGELLDSGVDLIAVTALVVAWVTVGVIQLPMEALVFGSRFAFCRNLLSFLFSLAIAFMISGILHVFG